MKTVLITGATAGFGRETARRFVAGGWKVVGTGRRAERLEELSDELGAGFHGVVFDVTDVAAMRVTLGRLPAEFAAIDLLINNAGLALGTKPVPEVELTDWFTMIDTNTKGLVAITQEVLPTLIERRGGIINLSSIAGNWPYPGGNVYGATKAFVKQFSLNLRADLHGKGVRVTSLEPGMATSEFTLVRTKGSAEAHDKLYSGANPLTSKDLAETMWWIANLPPHMNVNSLEVMPVSQSFAGLKVHYD
ncbi:SDR family NAD(P)-dependent oxidoreductase [Falsirhodobacter sp. 20TX0035]|uniref:SDR family NAD(P)-dependent oxidoreductase n=1 Tax=Falsirhodobacter sp. 20TX0035 TaxID=3022019 RepID=UPI00233003CC|nr:SDR family NAD(P)-dependent oxidoreductase [Falsirhodobacter sp. 20TX0035]MDB6453601.1 SDR family NAD(P)-dependent oxidoreductase [Falsirhodobacter sp. 20TX0035]